MFIQKRKKKLKLKKQFKKWYGRNKIKKTRFERKTVHF